MKAPSTFVIVPDTAIPFPSWTRELMDAFRQYLIDQPDIVQIDMEYEKLNWQMYILFKSFDFRQASTYIQLWLNEQNERLRTH
jgi:hypothetical protein